MSNKKESTSKLRPKAKFLVFVDDSEDTHIAVRFTCSKAKIKNRPVEMLFVIDPSDYATMLSVGDVMKEERRNEVEQLLQTLAEEAYEWSGIMPSIHIREGDAAEEIVTAIEEDNDINMLFVSSNPSESSGGTKLLGELANVLDERLLIPMIIIPAHLNDRQIEELN